MRISFCTTCANRLYQLQQTFDANLAIVARHPETEWVIANLGSRDALHEFMMARLPVLPANIVYVREAAPRPWHMSIAKNIAHRIASGDVLVNLDCDNFIGDTLELLREPLARGTKVVHLWSGTPGDGTCGRIAIDREIFHAHGGYDETFYPVGHEEMDLLKRVKESGATVEHVRCPAGAAVMNTKEEGVRHCALEGVTWKECVQRNRKQSEANILDGKLIANQGRRWGEAALERFFPPSRSSTP